MKRHILTQLVYIILDWFPETLAGVSPAEDGLEVNVKEGDFLHRSNAPRLRCHFVALVMALKNGQFFVRYERLVLFITVGRYIPQLKVCFRAKGVEDRQVQLKHTASTVRARHGIEERAARLLVNSHCRLTVRVHNPLLSGRLLSRECLQGENQAGKF
jgi:hypothetical protein